MSLRRFFHKILLTGVLITCAQFAFAGSAHSLPRANVSASVHRRRLRRGRYLVESLAHCFQCHSEEDFQHRAGQPLPGRRGVGRIVPPEDSGVSPPYRLVCPNITPDRETGAGTWTDAQFERAIRHGIGHDGRVLSGYMPYWNFRALTDEDLASIITYIRSIPAVRNPLPKRSLPQQPKIDMHDDIAPPPPPPTASQQVKHGYYLVRIGNCNDCHTATNVQGDFLPQLRLAGGNVLQGKWGLVVSPNITPDPSGISYYDLERFKQVLRTGYVGARKLNPLMPWSYFRHLTDDDIAAIFAYLRTIPPVRHRVDNTEPPTYCKVCGNRHGYGDHN